MYEVIFIQLCCLHGHAIVYLLCSNKLNIIRSLINHLHIIFPLKDRIDTRFLLKLTFVYIYLLSHIWNKDTN